MLKRVKDEKMVAGSSEWWIPYTTKERTLARTGSEIAIAVIPARINTSERIFLVKPSVNVSQHLDRETRTWSLSFGLGGSSQGMDLPKRRI